MNLCEPCTFSQGQVEDSLPTSSSGTRQLSLLSGMPMPVKSSEKEQQTDGSPSCQCGKGMSECSIHPNTPEKWIASMQDSLAKILALPENKQGLAKKQGVASTAKSSASLAWFDRVACSWKTSQQSFLTDSEQSSVTWPRSGMTANGYAYELPTVGRNIIGTDGGYLPTPTSSDPQLERRAKHGIHYVTETGTVRRKNEDGTSSMLGLAGFVRMFPTPTAHNAKETAAPSEFNRNTPTLAAAGGNLNPLWTEWLMGWPIGWTGLKQSEMGKSRSKRQSPGNSSEASK